MKKLTTVVLLLCAAVVLQAQDLTQFTDSKGKRGFKSVEGKIVIPAKYAEVTDFNKGFAAVFLGAKWGLININGKVVIPVSYDYVEIDRLSNGMIPCALAGAHHAGILDTSGLIIVPMVYDVCKISSKTIFIVSKNNLSGVYNIGDAYHNYDVKTKTMEFGQITIPVKYAGIILAIDDKMKVIDNLLRLTLTDKSGKNLYGLSNYDGLEILPCEYETIGLFHDGKAAISKNGGKFYIDTKGTIIESGNGIVVTPANVNPTNSAAVKGKSYSDKGPVSEGITRVKNDTKYGYIDEYGKEIVPLIYDDAFTYFSEGTAAVKQKGKWGFVNRKGVLFIPAKYDGTGCAFHDGVAIVGQNGKWGYINTKGVEIVPPIYEYALSFTEGLGVIVLNGKHGMVNNTGKIIIPLIYEKADYFIRDSGVNLMQNGKWGFVDSKGKTLIPFLYEEPFTFKNGLAAVKLNDKWGDIDTTGKVIVAIRYDRPLTFDDEGLASIRLYNKWGIINKSGIEIIPPIYDDIWGFINGKMKVMLKGQILYLDKSGKQVSQ